MDDLRPVITWALSTSLELSDKEAKRHLRITDYAVLDFYRQTTQEALEGLNKVASAYQEGQTEEGKKALNGLLERRRLLAQDDRQARFWRLAEGDRLKGRELIVYLDSVRLVTPLLGAGDDYSRGNSAILRGPSGLSRGLGSAGGFPN